MAAAPAEQSKAKNEQTINIDGEDIPFSNVSDQELERLQKRTSVALSLQSIADAQESLKRARQGKGIGVLPGPIVLVAAALLLAVGIPVVITVWKILFASPLGGNIPVWWVLIAGGIAIFMWRRRG